MTTITPADRIHLQAIIAALSNAESATPEIDALELIARYREETAVSAVEDIFQ